MSAHCEQTPGVLPGGTVKLDEIKNEVDVTEEETDLIDLKNNTSSMLTVRCGPLTAKMHVEHFLCPGIHQKCIEVEGEPGLITPKAFTIKANKDKQKDWKGSIRIGKSNLRTLMEMRTFDFYNHSSFCSAKCQSRNYITPKEKDSTEWETRRSSLTNKPSLPVFPTALYNPTPDVKTATLGMNFDIDKLKMLPLTKENSSLFKDPSFTQLMQITQVLRQNNNKFSASSSPDRSEATVMPPSFPIHKEELIDVDDTLNITRIPPIQPAIRKPQDVENVIAQMTQDPTLFWSEMVQCGLSDQIIDQMIDSLNGLRDKMKNGSVSNVSPFLSRSIASLGICDKVVSMIRRRNSYTAHTQHRLSTDYSSAEDTMIRKRSIDDSAIPSEAPPAKRPSLPYIPSFQVPTTSTSTGINLQQAPSQLNFNQKNVDMISALLLQAVPNQSPSEMLMQFATNISATNQQASAAVLSRLNESLLAIK